MITTLNTGGSGYWSRAKKPVEVEKIEFHKYSGGTYGEARVWFSEDSWNVNEDGLIYTDRLWIKEFRSYLKNKGFSQAAIDNIGYSEQGMQGELYVSLDFGQVFFNELDPLFQFLNKASYKPDWEIIYV